jgi:Ca2+-binding EF-hand superfamily protein
MEKLKMSPSEVLKSVVIEPIEQECLDRVFNYLISRDNSKPEEHKNKIGPGDILKVLLYLGLKPLKSEVALIIWEVDDDLDGYVSREEFQIMYKRCKSDETEAGLEPRKLFNLVQFLMFDKTFKGTVTVEDSLQILFVRHGRLNLDTEITAIFGESDKNPDGTEKAITFGEYVDKVNKRALAKQNEIMLKRKKKDVLCKRDEDDD